MNSPGLYIKDVTYNDRSVMYEPLRSGSAPPSAGLKVIVAQDGGTLSATVLDKDGSPVPDRNIVLMPGDRASEGMVQARMVTGQTDQTGLYTSRTLPPAGAAAVKLAPIP